MIDTDTTDITSKSRERAGHSTVLYLVEGSTLQGLLFKCRDNSVLLAKGQQKVEPCYAHVDTV